MITNNLSRLDRYDYHNKRFQTAFDFLRNSDLLSLTPGSLSSGAKSLWELFPQRV